MTETLTNRRQTLKPTGESQMNQPQPPASAARWVNWILWGYTLLLGGMSALAWTLYLRNPKITTSRPLFDLLDRGHDLTNYTAKIANLHHGAKALATGLPVFNYPAPAAFVYKTLFKFFPVDPYGGFVWLVVLATTALFGVACRAALGGRPKVSGTAAALLVTAAIGSPILLAADRGNLEAIVWIVCAAGVALLLAGRLQWAAVLIGIAASIKPFPGLFLLVLAARRQFKELALGIGVAVLMMASALTALGPNPIQAYRELMPGVQRYFDHYVKRYTPPGETRFAHSLLDGMKSLQLIREVRTLNPDRIEQDQLDHLARAGDDGRIRRPLALYPYMTAAVLLVLCAVFYRKPLLNQLTAAAVAVTLLPLSSAEYTLLYLYLPFAGFVIFLARDVVQAGVPFAPRAAAWFCVTMGLLFAPLTMFRVLAGDIKMVLLSVLLALAARYPMKSPYFEGRQPAEVQ